MRPAQHVPAVRERGRDTPHYGDRDLDRLVGHDLRRQARRPGPLTGCRRSVVQPHLRVPVAGCAGRRASSAGELGGHRLGQCRAAEPVAGFLQALGRDPGVDQQLADAFAQGSAQ